jgi:hypothetical protein
MYNCYLCESSFENQDEAVLHLKNAHQVKNKTHQMKCLINFVVCGKTYSSFAGLKSHHIYCKQTKQDEVTNKNCSILRF